MLARIATLATLALLGACGSDTSPPPSSAPASKPTASQSQPADHVMPAHPAAPADKPGALPDSSSTSKSKSTAELTPAPTSKPSSTTPSSTTPSSTTPSSTTPSSTTPSSTTPSSTTPSSTTPSSTASTAKPYAPSSPTAVAPSTKPAVPPMPDSDSASGIVHDQTAATGKSGALADAGKDVTRAIAHVTGASGSQVSGTITFVKKATGLEVHVVLDGLKPGDHGLHVHEKGDCSAADASSAGDHFNPGNMPHGGRDAGQRHAGDFGNITADTAGHVDVTFTDMHVALSGDTSILGRAIVVHADKDDGMTQPSGNSGVRVACGVIEEDHSEAGGVGG